MAAAVIPAFEPGSRHFAQLAHEIRGPLMALATSTEVLGEEIDTLERDQIRHMVKAIRSRALWLQGLVENVLCAAAVQSGTFRLSLQRVSLLTVIDEVHLLLAPVLAQREQPLRVRARRVLPGREPGTETDVVADGRRVGQVLINLILNASKYAPRGAPIDVILGAERGFLRVAVADRGPGLPAGGGARLFEPFHRGVYGQNGQDDLPGGGGSGGAVRTQTPAPEGVGLGLAIARAIMDAHGGRIGARRRSGGGAVFWFDLRPAENDSPLTAGRAAPSPHSQTHATASQA